ncbi:MAG: DUF4143 domain-containing protein [Chitinivibrionales bacterium]|nr:DUF4143 domain-containing protein [Chitinivibrionales bacterium]MBD3394382.1 DUF4143 domain-containing protein [Chitinivibrionales bacterium]
MYIQRHQSSFLKRLFDHFPVVVVSGARQVGKSTLIDHLFGDSADTVVFDPVIDIESARADPDLFLANHATPLILDEFQYAPQVASALKRKVDKDKRPGQYVLSGSQQWEVMKSLSESLAGRAVFVDLHSFSVAEILGASANRLWLNSLLDGNLKALLSTRSDRGAAGLYEQLWRGFLPEAQALPLDLIPAYFQAYERTYIDRDIRTIADFADIEQFGKFFRLLCALTAQELNYRQLGRELSVHPQTVERWRNIIVSTFQWFQLPAFHGNAIKRLSSKPKGYLSDTGLVCFALSINTPGALADNPLRGHLFETAAIAELRKSLAALHRSATLYHWRTHAGAEVDCILEYDGTLYPMEIKLSTHPSRRDATGLRAFRDTYPSRKIGAGIILSPIEQAYALSEHDYVVPWDGLAG